MKHKILEKLEQADRILVSGYWYIIDEIDEEKNTVMTINDNNRSKWTEFSFDELEDARFFGGKEIKDDEPEVKFNNGHIVEGLQTCHIIMSMLDDFLIDHPATVKIDGNDEIRQAQELIMKVYQRIGNL